MDEHADTPETPNSPSAGDQTPDPALPEAAEPADTADTADTAAANPDEVPVAATEPGPGPDEPDEADDVVAPSPRHVITRRGVLLSAAAVVVSAGGGVGAAALRHHRKPPAPVVPPAVLVQALVAERTLLASVEAASAAQPLHRTLLSQLTEDHQAHEQALVATLRAYPGAASAAQPSALGPVPALAALRTAEQLAAQAAAARALQVSGSDAALLASIAACEATHVELLG
jgi:hypothetical protein